MKRTVRAWLAATLSVLALSACNSGTSHDVASGNEPQPPNILFVVLDDLGVDQLSVFGYGGATKPKTPSIDTIAYAGVRFRNAWSMPTCTPSRATFFQGRYPFRTDIKNAVVASDLANSQVSPYEITTPRLLKQKGYVNAVIGKMHLSGSNLNPANNPLGDSVMHELGWDYFEGYLDGGPYPIDTTAGGANHGGGAVFACGFVPNTINDPANGADSGACYQPNGSCTPMSTPGAATPGLSCLAQGGLFDPGESCKPTVPAHLNFSRQNGYYTSELIINRADGSVDVLPPSEARTRGYRSTRETDRAIDWVKQQAPNQPWMLSVGYSAIHTPLQPPPISLLPGEALKIGAYACSADLLEQHALTDHMLEALDKEIGRLLVGIGIARYAQDGSLVYSPESSNTVVIVMADNGTFGPSVKLPFDLTRAKGFPYQSGVWVPLIVAGPMVKDPGRVVEHMVNSVDLYSLFGELAGIKLEEALPESRQVDAQPMLAYLTEPDRQSIRSTNYTEMGTNIASINSTKPPPCVIPSSNVCVQVFPHQGICEDQGGQWYGDGGVAGTPGLDSCCEVNDYLASLPAALVDILPYSQRALRNDVYKLVRIERQSCTGPHIDTVDELYKIDQDERNPKLDESGDDLLTLAIVPPEAQQNLALLQAEMRSLLESHSACPGDGNLDLVVDSKDIDGWNQFSSLNGGRSSWYDFNHDGLTNTADLIIIQNNMGKDCRPS
ncbi:sulfatase-like hydrolase/transferase [Alcaligenaceae bacterium]|nr:sulfatase-like hydrolase/transferase [Alcaligenaceae bacterium]